jgi:hypothetical protein
MLVVLAVVLASATKSLAEDVIVLNSYKCSEFLADTKDPADGIKLLRSLMMIAWATGYAAAQQQGAPRADPASLQLISATIGESCRNMPKEALVVEAITKAITVLAVIGSTPAGKQIVGDASSKNQAVARPAAEHDDQIMTPEPSGVISGPFFQYNNFDIPGSDLRTLKNRTLATCSAACQADSACSAFSFDKWNLWCFLKSNAGLLSLDASSVTAVKKDIAVGSPSGNPTRIDYRPGRRLTGNSVSAVEEPSLQACELRCKRDQNCVAYTFLENGKNCRVFGDVSAINSDAGASSGLKTQSQR